jgi:ADP-heptose:LPS heptosyltransferase
MISVDSAAAHVAAATNVPVVSVHGPSPASFSRPYSTKSRAVELENVPCRPCLRACTQPRNFCLLDLDVPPVASALKEMGIV